MIADELERLAKEATPGEWSVFDSGYADDRLGIEAEESGVSLVVYGDADRHDDCGVHGRDSAEAEANAALIVALRNALPQIISALRREESLIGESSEVRRWDDTLGDYFYDCKE